MERTVDLGSGTSGTVSVHQPVLRYAGNPILTAHSVNEVWRSPALQVVTVHNAGAALVGGETVLLFRSHLRCGVSVLGLARSAYGITDWQVDPRPVLVPAAAGDRFGPGVDPQAQVVTESGGVEDARINRVEGTLAVTYSGYSAEVHNRVRVALATTDDCRSFTRYGPMLAADMRNVVLFPERIDGRYVGLFRPNDTLEGDTGGAFTQIRVGYAADFRTGRWEIDDRPVMRTGWGPSAFADKIGPGAPPIRTRHGWLNLFHGVRSTMDGNPYVLGVALHDLDDPRRIRMSSIPVLFPSRADCRVDETDYVHVPQVVFCCGMLRRDDGTLLLYYAGNDTVMNLGFSHEDVLAELCGRYGQDPLTGALHYQPWG
ncbi:MAG: glycosidase [Frankiaceae bacterium]